MSKRDPKPPLLMPRYSGFRRIDEIMNEMFAGLELQRPAHEVTAVFDSSLESAPIAPNDSASPYAELRDELAAAAADIRRGLERLRAIDVSPIYPRADLSRVEKWTVADVLGYADELMREAQRLAQVAAPGGDS